MTDEGRPDASGTLTRKGSKTSKNFTRGPFPALLVTPEIHLNALFDPGQDDRLAWEVPILGPYRVNGDTIEGWDEPSDHVLRPRQAPWLPSEFAHIAEPLVSGAAIGGRMPAEVRAVKFANQYGLTGEWVLPLEAGEAPRPPRTKEVSELLDEASRVRSFLARMAAPDATGELFLDVLARLGRPPAPRITSPSVALLAGAFPTLEARYEEPLDLLDIIRLMLFADLQAGLLPRTCPAEGCRKVFIWPSDTRRNRDGTKWGRPPRYCSRKHAAAQIQRDYRRRKEEKES
jgi:hypothetical protein